MLLSESSSLLIYLVPKKQLYIPVPLNFSLYYQLNFHLMRSHVTIKSQKWQLVAKRDVFANHRSFFLCQLIRGTEN